MILFCDIDHTISDASWRDGMIGGDGGWDAYHLASENDKPITEMIWLVNHLKLSGWLIICLTTRPEKWRQLTMGWLIKHGVHFDELVMRPDKDFRPAPIVKVEQAQKIVADLTRCIVIDDREDTIEAFKAIGVTTLQVSANGRQEFVFKHNPEKGN